MREQNDPQAARVDELQLIEVEYDQRSGSEIAVLERALKRWRARQVEFPAQVQHHPVLLTADVNPKMILNCHR